VLLLLRVLCWPLVPKFAGSNPAEAVGFFSGEKSSACLPSEEQARELISGPSRSTRIRLLSLTRAQSRVVTGLLTGHSTLRRHLHLMGLTDSPLCRKCGAEDETSVHILCRCEALASIRQAQLGSFFMEPHLGDR
jgi:predicted Zn-ribbon and HTH transcriptional regulator